MYVRGGGLFRLKEQLSELAESEAKIAEYILRHPDEFVNMTVQELAKNSGGSPAAATRLWKSLGFDGYHDFQLRVASDLQMEAGMEYTELQVGSSFDSVLRSVEESHIHSIQNTLMLLKETDIQAVAIALLRAKRILTFGVGASGVIAADFAQKLLRVGFPSQYSKDFHTAAMVAAQMTRGDVLVVISYSGKTSDSIEVAQIALNNGATVLAITRFGESPLSKIATTKLYISAVEPQFRVAATSSRVSALAIIDAVFIYLVNQFHSEIYPSLQSTRNAVKSHKLE